MDKNETIEYIYHDDWWLTLINYDQWPLQVPKLKVPTICKAYVFGLNFRGYTPNYHSQKYGTVPPF